jgi:MFS family permease
MTDLNQPAYRWVVVIASALILAVSMGAIVNGITAFVVPMQEAFGWQRGTVSLINFSGIIGLAFGGMVMGRVADKRGVRPVVLFGAVMLGLTYILASFMHEPWQFYALFVFGGFFGAGAIFAPVMAAVGGWFRLGAGLAIGIASAGQALGQGGVPFGSTFLISGFGLSGAFMATGIIMLVVLVPLALLLRPAPAQTATAAAQTAMDEQALPPVKTLIAWMSPAVVLCCTCMSVPLMHLVPLLQDKGLAPERASSVIFVMLMAGILGRIAFGKLADIIGSLRAYMTATAWMTVMVAGFLIVDTLPTIYLYAVIYGFGYAGVMTGILVSVRMLTRAEHRAGATGTITLFGWFGHAIGGTFGGVLFDLTGAYTATYLIAAAAGVVNLLIISTFYRRMNGPSAPLLATAS